MPSFSFVVKIETGEPVDPHVLQAHLESSIAFASDLALEDCRQVETHLSHLETLIGQEPKKRIRAELQSQLDALASQFDLLYVGASIQSASVILKQGDTDHATKQLVAKISAALAEHHQASLS